LETARIAELLKPYLAQTVLTEQQLNNISIYIDILLRWNLRMNLTAVRDAEEIVRRHFGESLFAAHCLFPQVSDSPPCRVIDVGSGAGFPGIPVKLCVPAAHVTLIEANHKKVAFLREVIRGLTLINIDVFAGRAEDYGATRGDVVTLRAVEKFGTVLPTAVDLIAPGGRLALLIGESQCQKAKDSKPALHWNDLVPIPNSHNRVVLVASNHSR
jgi:16S rRNA (guanine527-N7)-methyltransferase